MEVESEGLRLDNYCRVKILLDIGKSLRRSQRIKGKDGRVITIDYKYERLPFSVLCVVSWAIVRNITLA